MTRGQKAKTIMIGQAELDSLRPTLARIARVAKTMFGAPAADVNIFQGDEMWRASETLGNYDPASDLARQTGEVIWVQDLTRDARFKDHAAVTGVPHLRFYAGAPIAVASGERIGALAIYGLKPRKLDKKLASRLKDLADVVGHECDLALAQSEKAALLDEVRRQGERLDIAARAANLHVFDMDFVEQTLTKAGAEDTFFEIPRTYEMLTNNEYDHVHPSDRPEVASKYKAMAFGGKDLPPMEWRVNRRDGQEIWVNAAAKVFRDEAGRPLRMVGSIQNVTDRKQHERALAEAKAFAEAANVAKSAFLATMSHEIRTPLNGVLGMAQAMASDTLTPVQRDRLDVIRESGESLLAILNDILDFSKIEAGKLELEEIDFDLDEIARGAYAAFTAMANKKGLSFALDIDQAKGLYRGDPTRVRQILYNLISNALKFTETGEIRVSGDYDGANLNLRVTDTGIGMSAETVASLFSKFAQADASTTRQYGGTGLGLAICKELTVLMNGTIGVESEQGKGSTFKVSLPLKRIGAAKARAQAPVETAPEAIDIRVLAAEDNSINQLVLKTLLHQIGIEPTVVENGQLALEAWEKGQWDIILMDVQMPVMDGPTAVREIRRLEAETGRAHTPIIALTANAMSHQVAEYLEAGMDGHLAKPIEAAKLFAVLASVLDGEEDEGGAEEAA